MKAARNQPALVAGIVILLDALAARLTLTADQARVYVLGRPIGWQCSMRRIGLPCPTCGMTRSIVITLHGGWAQAWSIAPGGPVLAAGLLALAVALCLFALRRSPWPRWLRVGGTIYAAAAFSIWLGGWAVQFAAALHTR
jgi:hypothetical protein